MDAAQIVALAERLIAQAPQRRDQIRSVVNGLLGDRLDGASAVAIPMVTSVRAGRHSGDDAAVACVFVHGLMGCAGDWGGEGDADAGLPQRLAETFAATPVTATYNSGRHISTNGRELAAALEATFAAWPRLQTVCVVAHSMGGLVVRAACHYGLAAGHAWVTKLRKVFMLGTPAHGAPLEQVAHVAAFTLNSIWNPWTKLVGRAINLRSAGIKDLRHGFVLDEDWRHVDVDQLRLATPRIPSLPEHTRWFAAVGALGEDDAWLTRVFGDGMVRPPSAAGEGFGSPHSVLGDVRVRRFANTSHMALLRDPEVADQVVAWWGEEQLVDSGN